MIKNSRQAAAARRKRNELLHAAERARPGQESGYLALVSDLARELSEYEAIRDGQINEFEVDSIDSLGDALIKARLARGWTHRQLASVLEVSEQMIQKDEARAYERAGLARVAEIADGLGYQLSGYLSPNYLPPSQWRRASTQMTMGASTSVRFSSWPGIVPTTKLTLDSGAAIQVYAPVALDWLPSSIGANYPLAHAWSTNALMDAALTAIDAPHVARETNTFSPAILAEGTGRTS
jgi:ribosome-binding protein aMBF1 (putative translation factor)